MISFANSHEHAKKKEIIKIYGKYLTFFSDLDGENKQKLSGLDTEGVKLALEREFTELILWQSNEENLVKFKEYLDFHDLKIIKGGRFHHISNNINKGISMRKLANEYKKYYPDKNFTTVAIGDSDNDFEMLNYADYPCIVKSSDNQNFVENIKSNNLFISNKQAPEGWAECINEAFASIRRKK